VIASMAAPTTRPLGGIVDDLEDEDNRRGYEEEPAVQLVLPLLVRESDNHPTCDIRTVSAGMSPGAGSVRRRIVHLATVGNTVQCDRCGGWFGLAFTCGACQALGR
jgi:hypothetical protein